MRGEASKSWLCPTELDRGRIVDSSRRVRNIRLVGLLAVGVALLSSAPWIGWWVLIPFVITAVNLITVERRLGRSGKPERVSAWAVVTTLLTIAVGVALSGGPESPALPWMVLPAGVVAARFRPQVVIAALLFTMIVILACTLGVNPGATVNDPVDVIATLALLAGVVSIVWALQAAELHHRGEAILDPLTGLLNRHALVPRFIEVACQAQIARRPVCLMLCDVDDFKQINDEHGHDRGDAVLRDIAYELRKRLRSFELIYRLGGEEFLILLPGIGHRSGRAIGERLCAAVESAQPTGIRATISIGLSSARNKGIDYDTLFKEADEALYEAKRMGRNRVVAAPAAHGAHGEYEQLSALDEASLVALVG